MVVQYHWRGNITGVVGLQTLLHLGHMEEILQAINMTIVHNENSLFSFQNQSEDPAGSFCGLNRWNDSPPFHGSS
jgi:hypothetical protein